MRATELLENINLLLTKKEMLAIDGEEDPELNEYLRKYKICKKQLTPREKKAIELHYEKDYGLYRAIAEFGYSRSTFYRDLNKAEDKLKIILG